MSLTTAISQEKRQTLASDGGRRGYEMADGVGNPGLTIAGGTHQIWLPLINASKAGIVCDCKGDVLSNDACATSTVMFPSLRPEA